MNKYLNRIWVYLSHNFLNSIWNSVLLLPGRVIDLTLDDDPPPTLGRQYTVSETSDLSCFNDPDIDEMITNDPDFSHLVADIESILGDDYVTVNCKGTIGDFFQPNWIFLNNLDRDFWRMNVFKKHAWETNWKNQLLQENVWQQILEHILLQMFLPFAGQICNGCFLDFFSEEIVCGHGSLIGKATERTSEDAGSLSPRLKSAKIHCIFFYFQNG